jgi:hypothetical protein
MNFNVNELYALIEKEDPQNVADSFAKTLNEAIKLKAAADAEKAKKEAEEKLAKQKAADAKKIGDVCEQYIKKYYPGIADNLTSLSDFDATLFVSAIDEMCKELETIFPNGRVVTRPRENRIESDALAKFLRENGL